MNVIDELNEQVRLTVVSAWSSRQGQVVPDATQLGLGNDRVEMDAVFLYADLADSTELAISRQQVAAEVCKSYIRGVTRLIKENDGEVRSFDGDRVMGVFIGSAKNTNAARCGLQIHTFFDHVLTPKFKGYYGDTLTLKQTVGIDLSHVYVCRAGPKIDNDLIWVGRAPNIAAKLSAVRNDYDTLITGDVFANLHASLKNFAGSGLPIWSPVFVPSMTGYGIQTIYGTTAHWIFAP